MATKFITCVYKVCTKENQKNQRRKKSVHTNTKTVSFRSWSEFYLLFNLFSKRMCQKFWKHFDLFCWLVPSTNVRFACNSMWIRSTIVIRWNYFQPEPHFKNRCSHCISYIYNLCSGFVSRIDHVIYCCVFLVLPKKHLFSHWMSEWDKIRFAFTKTNHMVENIATHTPNGNRILSWIYENYFPSAGRL